MSNLNKCKVIQSKVDNIKSLTEEYNAEKRNVENLLAPVQKMWATLNNLKVDLNHIKREASSYPFVIQTGSLLEQQHRGRLKDNIQSIREVADSLKEHPFPYSNEGFNAQSFEHGVRYDTGGQRLMNQLISEVDSFQRKFTVFKENSGNKLTTLKSKLDSLKLTREEEIMMEKGICELEFEKEEKRLADTAAFQEVVKENTPQAYERYIAENPDGLFVKNAQQKIDAVDTGLWEKATTANNIAAYQFYLEQMPNGRYASTANNAITNLEFENEQRAIQQEKELEQLRLQAERAKLQAQLAPPPVQMVNPVREPVQEFPRPVQPDVIPTTEPLLTVPLQPIQPTTINNEIVVPDAQMTLPTAVPTQTVINQVPDAIAVEPQRISDTTVGPGVTEPLVLYASASDIPTSINIQNLLPDQNTEVMDIEGETVEEATTLKEWIKKPKNAAISILTGVGVIGLITGGALAAKRKPDVTRTTVKIENPKPKTPQRRRRQTTTKKTSTSGKKKRG